MFLVHHVPTARNETGTWVLNPPREPGFYHPESPALRAQRREERCLAPATAPPHALARCALTRR